MGEQDENPSEKVRNVAIMTYMVGNALTFTKLISDPVGLPATGDFGAKVLWALLSSLVWPVYWIGRVFFG